jgi:hypothetical protein
MVEATETVADVTDGKGSGRQHIGDTGLLSSISEVRIMCNITLRTKANDSPHIQTHWHLALHSNTSIPHNAQCSRSVPPVTISTLVFYATYLSLIIFKIIPHPMTLLIASPLQVIIPYLILYCLFSLTYCRITYPLSSSLPIALSSHPMPS